LENGNKKYDNENPIDTDRIGDNAAMSVDGDLSYFSGEMDETTTNNLINKDTVGLLNKKSSVFAPKTVVQQAPLKFKEANSSLHMI
jgi:hypothetical protein